MVSFNSLLAVAAVVAPVFAQLKIGFTSIPAYVVAGQTYNITWAGGDGTPVTLTLRKGNPNDLSTIGTLQSGIRDSYYLWTVNPLLQTASDYALQITQGQSDINYSGLFSLVGGSGTSSIFVSGLSTSSSASNGTAMSSTITGGSGISMGTGTTMPRNTTFTTPTLTSAATSTATSVTTRTTNTGTASATSAPNTNGAAVMGSSAALVMGVFGAVMFL